MNNNNNNIGVFPVVLAVKVITTAIHFIISAINSLLIIDIYIYFDTGTNKSACKAYRSR